MYGGYDTNPSHWDYCDLCSQRKYQGFPRRGVFYCLDCKERRSISADDVIDAVDTLNAITLMGTFLRILGVKEVYRINP